MNNFNQWRELQLGRFLKLELRKVEKPREPYLRLGIRSHGKGTFTTIVDDPGSISMTHLYQVKNGDLIVSITFAWEGAIALVGKEGDGALVSHRFPTYKFDTRLVLPNFFRYLMLTDRFVYDLGLVSPGSAGRNRVMNKQDFLKLKIKIPPIHEQSKIAEILNTWDEAIAHTEQLITALQERKMGVMQRLLTGEVRFPGFEDVWQKKAISDLGKVITGNTPPKNDPSLYGGDFPWVSPSDIDQYPVVSCSKTTLSAEGKAVARVVPPGSVLVTCIASLGKNSIAGVELAFNQQINSIVVNSQYNNVFVYYLIENFPNEIQRYVGATSVPIINKSTFERIKFLLPRSIEEQSKIADVLMTCDQELFLLKQRVRSLHQQKEGLVQRLLTGQIRVKVH